MKIESNNVYKAFFVQNAKLYLFSRQSKKIFVDGSFFWNKQIENDIVAKNVFFVNYLLNKLLKHELSCKHYEQKIFIYFEKTKALFEKGFEFNQFQNEFDLMNPFKNDKKFELVLKDNFDQIIDAISYNIQFESDSDKRFASFKISDFESNHNITISSLTFFTGNPRGLVKFPFIDELVLISNVNDLQEIYVTNAIIKEPEENKILNGLANIICKSCDSKFNFRFLVKIYHLYNDSIYYDKLFYYDTMNELYVKLATNVKNVTYPESFQLILYLHYLCLCSFTFCKFIKILYFTIELDLFC